MVGDFSDELAGCKTLEGVRGEFRREIARAGYTASACRTISPGRPFHYFFRDCPGGWPRVAEANNLATRSLVLAAARQRMLPFTWTDVVAGRTLSAADHEVFEVAAAWGWVNGFVVPIHGPDGYLACVGMDSPERDLDLGPDQRARLHMIAVLTHERCRALASAAQSTVEPRVALSPRERECMRWVAAGKTDWEIGVIMSISSATVKFHVDRARRKLKAVTRAHAVARGIMGGLL